MSAFATRVSGLTGVGEDRIERLSLGLSEVLLVERHDGQKSIAKASPAVGTEAAMLRALAAAGLPVPRVEGEHEGVLLLDFIENDAVMSANAWADVAAGARSLHDRTGTLYGWPVDYALGRVAMDNRETSDWPRFWGEQRLVSAASLLDRPWRERVDRLAARLGDLLPASPRTSLLHGDLWTGNILVRQGRLVALVDPACYHGDAEVDLAMLALFDAPPEAFWDAYGALEPGASERLPLYQLYPALVHMRLFGAGYAAMTDRLLTAVGA